MNRSKKFLIISIVILIILMLGGGALAYTYFFTDVLKTNQQLFEKYASEINAKAQNFIKDDNLDSYLEKKQTNPYENSGTINVNKTASDNKQANLDLLEFSGVVDNNNKAVAEDIKVHLSKDVYIPLEFVRNSDKYGIISSDVVNKYIVVNNNKLSEFFNKLDMKSSDVTLPDKIEMGSILTADEIQSLETSYINKIKSNVTEANFSQEKENNKIVGYALSLSDTQIKTINKQWLEELKNNTIITSRINDTSFIDDIINQIDKEDISGAKIIVYKNTNNAVSSMIKIITNTDTININFTNTTINIVSENEESNSTDTQNSNLESINNSLKEYNGISITKNLSSDTSTYNIDLTNSSDNSKNISISLEFADTTTSNANEKIVLSLGVDNIITYTNKISFKNEVNTITLNDDNSVIINNYTKEDLQNLVTAIETQIESVIQQKSLLIPANDNNNIEAILLSSASTTNTINANTSTNETNATNLNNSENTTTNTTQQELLDETY